MTKSTLMKALITPKLSLMPILNVIAQIAKNFILSSSVQSITCAKWCLDMSFQGALGAGRVVSSWMSKISMIIIILIFIVHMSKMLGFLGISPVLFVL